MHAKSRNFQYLHDGQSLHSSYIGTLTSTRFVSLIDHAKRSTLLTGVGAAILGRFMIIPMNADWLLFLHYAIRSQERQAASDFAVSDLMAGHASIPCSATDVKGWQGTAWQGRALL